MKKICTLFICLLCLSSHASLEEGLKIAQKMDAASDGYIGESSTMKLVLIDATGRKIEREMLGESSEKKDMDKTLMSFVKPFDVKGTKLLTWSKQVGDDEQWLYLPSLKRVKKINSQTKGSSFMGSEFSFEDLGGQAIEKYTFFLKGNSKVGSEDVWILERKAKENSSYARVILYVSKKFLSTVKTEYYNKRNELLKVAVFSGFVKYKVGTKEIYRPSSIEMNNIQSKKKSIFSWEDRKVGIAISDSHFSQESLK